jgi:hypothetical protein
MLEKMVKRGKPSCTFVALSRMARMRRPGLNVILTTAYDIPGIEDEAIGPILRKPIDEEHLVAEVKGILAAA